MKHLVIFIVLQLLFHHSHSQIIDTMIKNQPSVKMLDKFGKIKESPLLYLNCSRITGENLIEPNLIEFAFEENLRFELNGVTNKVDSSIFISKYFDFSTKKSVVFFFTKDKIQIIENEDFSDILTNTINPIFKINNEPLSNDYLQLKEKLHSNKIKMVRKIENFTLKKWNSGEEDVYTLFIIKW